MSTQNKFSRSSSLPGSICPICPQCSFPPVPICSFALVALLSIGPKMPIILHSAHLPQISVCPCAHFSWCPFSPSAYLPPKAHLSLCPLASKVLVCPIKCPKYPFAPVTSSSYNCVHFSSYPFFSSAHLPQIAK